ncbi:ATP-dependent DNA helicase PIF1-like protein [Tanacetum coccineum]
MKELKESKKTSRRQPGTGGSSEETGVSLGVPDESTIIPGTSSEGTESEYSKEEDDDETITWVDTDEEEEKKDDDDDKSINLEQTKFEDILRMLSLDLSNVCALWWMEMIRTLALVDVDGKISMLDLVDHFRYLSVSKMVEKEDIKIHIVEEDKLNLIDMVEDDKLTEVGMQTVDKHPKGLDDNFNESLYSPDVLNCLKFSGIPNHRLALKVGAPVMLLRNIDQSASLCNGTGLRITKLGERCIEAEIITGTKVGGKLFLKE